ncbi:hypothetical protein BH10PLA2_BH10PLA2_06950 [soil metagenome]
MKNEEGVRANSALTHLSRFAVRLLNHDVVSSSYIQVVLSQPADQDVVAQTTEEAVSNVAADQHIVAITARYMVKIPLSTWPVGRVPNRSSCDP